MPNVNEEAPCAACGEVGWTRSLYKDYGRLKKGSKLCRTCFKEIVKDIIEPQTQYRARGRIVSRHTDLGEDKKDGNQ